MDTTEEDFITLTTEQLQKLKPVHPAKYVSTAYTGNDKRDYDARYKLWKRLMKKKLNNEPIPNKASVLKLAATDKLI